MRENRFDPTRVAHRDERTPSTARRRFLAAVGGTAAIALAGCADNGDPGDDGEEPDDDHDDDDHDDDELETVDPAIVVPGVVEDGEPVYGEYLTFRDYASVKHAVYISGAVARDSEFGHENYRPELAEDFMRERGEAWLDLVETIEHTFWDDGAISPTLAAEGDEWYPDGDPALPDYPLGGYAWHMHHRGGRFSEHGDLEDRIYFEPADYVSSFTRHALNEHYEDGEFHHADGTVDQQSMAHGLGAIHSASYAWVRWNGDNDDMALADEDVLAGYLEYDTDDLVDVMREIKPVLDDHWDDDVGMYDFGDGTTYHINCVAGLLLGHKAMYEVLYQFGSDDEDAEELADRTARMVEPLLGEDVGMPCGLPELVEYTADGVEPASDTADVGATWEFITHVTAGWSLPRENESENSPQFLTENHPDVLEAITEFVDWQMEMGLLEGAQLDDDGYPVAELAYGEGEITDDSHTAYAVGMFVTGLGINYRAGDLVERARDWDDADDELLERSEEFHDRYVELSEYVFDYFVQH